MNKTILVALLAAVATAQMTINTPFYKFLKPRALLKSINHPVLQGTVTWANCDSDGGFKTDFTNTKSNPLVPVKGQNVDLILQGIFTDDADLDAIKTYCEWNNTPLYQEEFSRVTHYNSGDLLKDKITWFIPGFAPTGHYSVKLTLHDKGTITTFGCIQADFDL